jgi:hypothetical protein
MSDSNLDLRGMSEELKKGLEEYADLFSGYFSFERDFPHLRLTPEKPYTARTEIMVHGRNKDQIGTLYALVFKFHDGTGDDSTFKQGDLELPGRFKPMKDPRKVFPRSKQGIRIEAFFPFFTEVDGKYFRHVVCLEELTVDDPEDPITIVTEGTLGMPSAEYTRTLNGQGPARPQWASPHPPLFLTCGYKDDARFGDPHAIYFSVPTEGVQVAGFLAVPADAEIDLETLGILFEAKGKLPLKQYQ